MTSLKLGVVQLNKLSSLFIGGMVDHVRFFVARDQHSLYCICREDSRDVKTLAQLIKAYSRLNPQKAE